MFAFLQERALGRQVHFHRILLLSGLRAVVVKVY